MGFLVSYIVENKPAGSDKLRKGKVAPKGFSLSSKSGVSSNPVTSSHCFPEPSFSLLSCWRSALSSGREQST